MIRQDIKNWDPSIADLELLAQALRRCTFVDIGKDLNMEDLNNLQTIIEQVIIHSNENIGTLSPSLPTKCAPSPFFDIRTAFI